MWLYTAAIHFFYTERFVSYTIAAWPARKEETEVTPPPPPPTEEEKAEEEEKEQGTVESDGWL